MRPISEIADSIGIPSEHVIPYGQYKAKIHLDAIKSDAPRGKLILMTGMTPTRRARARRPRRSALLRRWRSLGTSPQQPSGNLR